MQRVLEYLPQLGWWSSLGIPVLFIVAAVLAKMLIKKRLAIVSDFFLGVEGGLATLTTITTDAFDTGRSLILQQAAFLKLDPRDPVYSATAKALELTTYRLVGTGFTFGISLLLFLVLLCTHQHYDTKGENNAPSRAQIIWLGFFANFLGFAPLVAFILFIKGVQ